MKRLLIVATICALSVSARAEDKKAGAAKPADKPAAGAEMMPPKPGAETAALKPFTQNLSIAGTMKAGMMGPNSPEMPTKGKHTCKWIADGFWAVCEIESTAGAGKQAMTMKGHLVVGYDLSAKEYRGYWVDSMGMSSAMTGKIDGTKAVWTSGEFTMMGQSMKNRVSIDATDPKALKFVSERSVKGGPWAVEEESTMKPMSK